MGAASGKALCPASFNRKAVGWNNSGTDGLRTDRWHPSERSFSAFRPSFVPCGVDRVPRRQTRKCSGASAATGTRHRKQTRCGTREGLGGAAHPGEDAPVGQTFEEASFYNLKASAQKNTVVIRL